MIPYAIFAIELHIADRRENIRALELSPAAFTFRLAEPLPDRVLGQDAALIPEALSLQLHFYSFTDKSFRHCNPLHYTIEPEEAPEGDALPCSYYRLWVEDPQYETYARDLTREYLQYIQLKQAGDDARLSQTLTGYPADEEACYADSWLSQKQQFLSAAVLKAESFPDFPEYGFVLDPCLPADKGNAFLSTPFMDFYQSFLAEQGLGRHPLSHRRPTHLYLGSSYCIQLLPSPLLLKELLEKCMAEGLIPVLQVPPVPEHAFDRVLELLYFYQDQLIRLRDRDFSPCASKQATLFTGEVLANDCGLLTFLGSDPAFTLPVLEGPLTDRGKRDPRQSYSSAGGEAAARLPYLPFYQTNTATLCTLYAFCHNGARGRQSTTVDCPKYCSDHVFLYPAFLNMVGRYNSLFACDTASISSGDLLEESIRGGLKRPVLFIP